MLSGTCTVHTLSININNMYVMTWVLKIGTRIMYLTYFKKKIIVHQINIEYIIDISNFSFFIKSCFKGNFSSYPGSRINYHEQTRAAVHNCLGLRYINTSSRIYSCTVPQSILYCVYRRSADRPYSWLQARYILARGL